MQFYTKVILLVVVVDAVIIVVDKDVEYESTA